MIFKFVTMMTLAGALLFSSAANAKPSIRPTVIEMLRSFGAEAKERFPWHHKVESSVRFRPATALTEFSPESYARSTFGWQIISRRLTNKRGAYPNFSMFLGITDNGELEGVVFGNGFSALSGDAAATKQLGAFDSVGISAPAVGELINMPLGPVQSAPIPGETHKVWFRKVKTGNKAYRMFGALPDESEISIYHTASGQEGSMNYWVGNRAITTAFTIGYLKEMLSILKKANQE